MLRLSRFERKRNREVLASDILFQALGNAYSILALRWRLKDFRSDPLYLWATNQRRKGEPLQLQVYCIPLLFSKPLALLSSALCQSSSN